MYKNSFFRFLPECKSTRKAMSYMLFMQCMGLRPVVKEILPFLCYVAILAAAVLPCMSFQTGAQGLDFAAMALVKKVWARRTESSHTPLLSITLGLDSSNRTGLCAQGEVQCSPNQGSKAPDKSWAAQFPVLHMCFGRWDALGNEQQHTF